jgi:bifunctional DNA-binding transcriptional regulator/antitoxin component of YhaV-PrlF toxin-antitoxin module
MLRGYDTFRSAESETTSLTTDVYLHLVSESYFASMGDHGGLVVPVELCERAGLHEGRPVVFIETPHGLLLLTLEQSRDLIRQGLEGTDLVRKLVADRRAAAAAEDVA